MTTALMLAGRSGEGWKSGPWGLAIILLLCVASYFLFKSMSKHLRKVREEFPTDDPPAAAAPADPDAPVSADARRETNTAPGE